MIPKINFDHCFKFLAKIEKFNDTYCQKCGKTGISLYKESIYYFPNYLIIILNRGKGNIFNCKVDIPIEFTPSMYVEKDKNSKFSLIGVVSHLGESNMGGHFIAFCRHNIDGKWRCYNDSIVTESQNDFLEKGTPYILFYQKNLQYLKKGKNQGMKNNFNINMNSQNNQINNYGNFFNNNFSQNNIISNNHFNNNKNFPLNNIISNNDYLKIMNMNMNNDYLKVMNMNMNNNFQQNMNLINSNNNIQLNNNMNNNNYPNMCKSCNFGRNMNMNMNNNMFNNMNNNFMPNMNINFGQNMNMNNNINMNNFNCFNLNMNSH